ncbi:ATP synthase F0 subunit B [Myxococcota bacterium]|nr:ATP synthase F0 subunit B [Myxococcota bacterium]
MRDRPRTSGQASKRQIRITSAAVSALILVALPGVAWASGGLQILPDPIKMLLLTVFFFALVIPVNALVFKPIFQALDDREHRIDGARNRAGQIAEQTDQALAQYEASLQAARAEADQARKQLVEAARHEQAEMAAASRDNAEALIEKARADLSNALDEATASIRSSSEELGQLAAERILGRSL